MTVLNLPLLLRKHGLRTTSGRLEILAVLTEEEKPITVEGLKEKLPMQLDTVTIYRALEALKTAGLVERADFQHGHAHYELIVGRPHHHHAVCRTCGIIEDVEVPHSATPEKDAQRRAKGFSIIDAYTLEFYGTCNSCA